MNKTYRIVKIEKRKVFIEYRTAPYGVWKQLDKCFKSVTQAQEYIATH